MIEDGQKVGRHSNQIPDAYQETGQMFFRVTKKPSNILPITNQVHCYLTHYFTNVTNLVNGGEKKRPKKTDLLTSPKYSLSDSIISFNEFK